MLGALAWFVLLPASHAADLSEVLTDAMSNDPRLGAARANYLARSEIVPLARSALLPNIGVGTQHNDNNRKTPSFPGFDSNSHFDEDSWQAQLTQPLFAPVQFFELRSAQAQRDSAAADFATAEQDLLIRVADAYFNVLRAQDALDSTKAEETAVRRQLEQVQQRFDVGLVAITDVLEAQAVYDNAVVRRIQADGNHDIFFENLRTLTGKNYSSLRKLAANLPVVYPEPRDEEVWVNEALATNHSIEAADKSLLAAKRDVRARQSAHLPTVQAVATYSEFETDSAAASFGSADTRVYSLQARLPIFQGGGTQARVREGQYRAEQAEHTLEDRKRSVARDTRNLFRAVITDVVRVRAGEKSVRSSEAALEATQTGYEVGTRNIVDVLQAQQRLFQSQFSYADSRYVYVLDLLRLKQASGGLVAADVMELNQFLSGDAEVSKLPIGRLYEEAAEPSPPTPQELSPTTTPN